MYTLLPPSPTSRPLERHFSCALILLDLSLLVCRSVGLLVCWSIFRRRIFISIYINIYFSNGKTVSISLLSFDYHLSHFCAWFCCGKIHTNNGEIKKGSESVAVRKSCLINDSEKCTKLSGYKLQIPFTFFCILGFREFKIFLAFL